MMPLEANQNLVHSSKSLVKCLIDASYKSNPFLNHQLFRQACNQTKHLYSKGLNVSSLVDAFDYSKNGDFFVAGTFQGTVALWRTAQFLGTSGNPKPALTMDFEHNHLIRNVTTSPDDLKIFSNGTDEIAIHDVNT